MAKLAENAKAPVKVEDMRGLKLLNKVIFYSLRLNGLNRVLERRGRQQ